MTEPANASAANNNVAAAENAESGAPTAPGAPAEPAAASADAAGFARGFRLSTELVAGVLVGAAIGWGLDRLAGISPWGLIVFVLLGFAAGVLNVMRAAGIRPGGPEGQ